MQIYEILKELQKIMALDFDERAIVFKSYMDILKLEVANNPSNIEAFCLMAMITCELREDSDKSIKILEQCYLKNQSSFSNKGFALWATDMAYFLLEECTDRSGEAELLLTKAINCDSNYSSTYYAYGKVCFIKKDFDNASKLFHKAFEKFEKKSYKYCEAVSLLANSSQEEGIAVLKSIYTYPFESEEIDVRIALTLGRALALIGEIDEAKKIAQILLKTNYKEFDIEIDEMADFMFLLKDYNTYIELYNKYQFFEENSWLKKYFYSLKQIGQTDTAQKKLKEITKEIEQDISGERMNVEDWDDYTEYESYICSETKRLKDIQEEYDKIFTHSVNILPDIYYDIYHECYYIYCPRHYV